MLKHLLLISLSATLLAACSSQQLTEAGRNVNFVDQQPAANCQYLGKAEGKRNGFFSGTKTHSELMRDAAKDLLNQAGAMGGNTVYQAQDNNNRILSGLIPANVTISGEVYRCP